MTESKSADNPTLLFVQRRRPSRWMRRLFLFGVVSTSSVVLCCAATIVVQAVFGPKFTTEPDEVEAIARKIASIQAPTGFKPAEAYSADNSLVWLQAARFDQEAGRGQLIIAEMHFRAQQPDDSAYASWMKVLIDKLATDLRMVEVVSQHEKSVMICGKNVVFQIVEGVDRASTTRLRQVKGTFPGHESAVTLILQGEQKFLTLEAIDALLDSLAEKPSAK
jgi:hypothetical protein